jgi:hypothetical protein
LVTGSRDTGEVSRQRMDSVFALEKTLQGGGRYVWEGVTQDSIQSDLRAAQQGLNTFRELARDNGIDAEAFLRHIGGEPSFEDCESTAQKFNS